MKPLPVTPELLRVARRVVWFREPADTLADPIHFLAHVMTWARRRIAQLRGLIGTDEFREVLERAPPSVRRPLPGLLNRSAAAPRPPLPERRPPLSGSAR